MKAYLTARYCSNAGRWLLVTDSGATVATLSTVDGDLMTGGAIAATLQRLWNDAQDTRIHNANDSRTDWPETSDEREARQMEDQY